MIKDKSLLVKGNRFEAITDVGVRTIFLLGMVFIKDSEDGPQTTYMGREKDGTLHIGLTTDRLFLRKTDKCEQRYVGETHLTKSGY